MVLSVGHKYARIAGCHMEKESIRTIPLEGPLNEFEPHPYKNEVLASLYNTPTYPARGPFRRTTMCGKCVP